MTMKESAVERADLANKFNAKHTEHRANVRMKSASTNSELMRAHQFALAAIVSYQDRVQGLQFSSAEVGIKGRMGLIAQFMQGIDITETAISEGLYAQAANLLKQELETLAAIEEYELGQRREGETPRFRGRLKGFGRR